MSLDSEPALPFAAVPDVRISILAALLRRFSSDSFALAGEPSTPAARRLPPPALTAFFEESQYGLLLDSEGSSWSFPSEACSWDEESTWQEVIFESVDGEETLLAKLGWSLVRDSSGCWVTDDCSWHDFRPEFRPGIGQEEWPRICG